MDEGVKDGELIMNPGDKLDFAQIKYTEEGSFMSRKGTAFVLEGVCHTA